MEQPLFVEPQLGWLCEISFNFLVAFLDCIAIYTPVVSSHYYGGEVFEKGRGEGEIDLMIFVLYLHWDNFELFTMVLNWLPFGHNDLFVCFQPFLDLTAFCLPKALFWCQLMFLLTKNYFLTLTFSFFSHLLYFDNHLFFLKKHPFGAN